MTYVAQNIYHYRYVYCDFIKFKVFLMETFSDPTSYDLGIFLKIRLHTLKILSVWVTSVASEIRTGHLPEYMGYWYIGMACFCGCTLFFYNIDTHFTFALLAIARQFSPGTVFCS